MDGRCDEQPGVARTKAIAKSVLLCSVRIIRTDVPQNSTHTHSSHLGIVKRKNHKRGVIIPDPATGKGVRRAFAGSHDPGCAEGVKQRIFGCWPLGPRYSLELGWCRSRETSEPSRNPNSHESGYDVRTPKSSCKASGRYSYTVADLAGDWIAGQFKA